LWQHCVMAEAIHVVTYLGGHAELFMEIALGIQPVPDVGFPAGNGTVGLHPPAADHFPASFLDALFDLGEHL
jgi:hypothetical protein